MEEIKAKWSVARSTRLQEYKAKIEKDAATGVLGALGGGVIAGQKESVDVCESRSNFAPFRGSRVARASGAAQARPRRGGPRCGQLQKLDILRSNRLRTR